jgi:hypothetical protein
MRLFIIDKKGNITDRVKLFFMRKNRWTKTNAPTECDFGRRQWNLFGWIAFGLGALRPWFEASSVFSRVSMRFMSAASRACGTAHRAPGRLTSRFGPRRAALMELCVEPISSDRHARIDCI